MPVSYQGLLGPLLTPTLWGQAGNVPALVRLLKAIMSKGSDALVAANQLNQVKDILRFLQNSGRKHEVAANDLVEGMFQYLPVYVVAIFTALCSPSDDYVWSRSLGRHSWASRMTFLSFCSPSSWPSEQTLGCKASSALSSLPLHLTVPALAPTRSSACLINCRLGEYFRLIHRASRCIPHSCLYAFTVSVFAQVLQAIMPELQKAPTKNQRAISIGLVRLLTQSQKMQQPPFAQQWSAHSK